MEIIKKTAEYQIFKKGSGRYAIQNPQREWIRGQDKVTILLKEKLIKLTPKKKVEAAAPAPEAKAEVAAETPTEPKA
jgi:hypothetical protein